MANIPKAELVLNRALKLKPDSPETLYLLAQVLRINRDRWTRLRCWFAHTR